MTEPLTLRRRAARAVRTLAFAPPVVPLTNAAIRHLEHVLAILRNNSVDPVLNGEEWLVRTLPRLRVAIDAGYNSGEFTQALLDAHPGVQVHAFDPCREVIEHHRRRHGDLPAARLHALALSDRPGHATFFDYGHRNGCNSLVERTLDFPAEVQAHSYQVEVTTLDAWVAAQGIEHIDLLKLDVEGFEAHALEGARGILAAQRVSTILFEYATGWLATGRSLAEVSRSLESLGYTVYRLFPGFLAPYEHRTLDEGRLFGMFVALSRDMVARGVFPTRPVRA